MTKTVKILVTGAVAALGLGSAAVAQQSNQPNSAQQQTMTPEQHRQMMSGGNMGQGHMQMMNDPQMRKQMMEMMGSCTRMMQMMGNMSGMNSKTNN